MLLSLAQALNLAGVDGAAQQVSQQASWHRQRIARLLRHPDRHLIHTVHHLACTGGTVISKCLAAMPRVALVSEVNPLNRFGSKFEPTNPLMLLDRSYRDLTLDEIKEDFVGVAAPLLQELIWDPDGTVAQVQLWLGVFPVNWQQLPDVGLLERQIATIRLHLGGSYRELLTAMLLDPALQISLNGPANHRRQPKDNLARELL